MMRYLILGLLFAFAMAQDHGNHNPGHNNHHPHPDGNVACHHNDGCNSCQNASLTALCNEGTCVCAIIVRRAPADCHNGHQCTCNNGDTGYCMNGHCDCGNHVGKRALFRRACHSNHQCNSCPPGQNGVCNTHSGQCECGDHAVGKRATQDHGNHNPGHNNHHPHPDGNVACHHNDGCNSCQNASLTALCNEGTCVCAIIVRRAQADCHNGHQCTCNNGDTGYCMNGHCDCGNHVGKRAIFRRACHSDHQCNSCPSGQNGVCNSQGHCECGDHAVGKRANCHGGGQCTCNDGSHGVCNSEGHCDCGNNNPVGKRGGEECQEDSQCPSCDHGGTPVCQNPGDNHPGHCHCKH